MKLPEFSVNRPVTVSMFYIGIFILGLISLSRLPRELFPSITYPQLTIVTSYENAAPEEVETLITKIIEEAVGTVSSLKRISSISKEGISIVTSEFNWGTNMDFASLGVREKIDLVKERLPLGSADPIVMKFNPFELPAISLSVTGNQSPSELLRLTRKFIKDELEKVEGVASCNVSGGLEREILVAVDKARLQATNISITKVVDALKSSNLNYPAGNIEEHFYEYLIRTMGEFKVLPEIKETVVGKEEEEANPYLPIQAKLKEEKKEERLIYLKDIADIKDTFQERSSISRYNGEENISVSVQKQAGVNTLLVAEKVRKRLSAIEQDLPSGMQVKIVYDQSIFIKKAIRGVLDAAMQGGVLAFIVLFIFLRNFKASSIVAFSMPISIMVAFSLMYFSGIDLNMLSLGGLALGIGMLVDSAIVVIENIYVHFQRTKDIKHSSQTGASQMFAAITSSILTTVAVFLPMIFVVGVAGQLFKELSLTVTYSLMASLVVALSLIPMLVAVTGKKDINAAKVTDKALSFTFGLGPIYTKLIPHILRHRALFLIGMLLLFILSFGFFGLIGQEFMPKIDQREFIMKVNMPTGTKLNVTDRLVKGIEKVLLQMKGTEGMTVTIGSSKKKDYAQGLETLASHQAQLIVSLKKGKEYDPTSEFIGKLKYELDRLNLEGAEIEYVLEESIFKTALQGAAPIVIEIKGKDLEKIEDVANYVKDGLLDIKGIYGIRTSLTKPAPETKVNIIKDKAAYYNLSTGAIAQAAHTAIKGIIATKFKEEGREIDIRVRLRKEDREHLSQVRDILIHSPLDIEVPLAEVAYISQGVGPSEIKRLDQQRVVLVTANIKDRALDKVILDINLLLEKIEREVIPSFGVSRTGEREINVELGGESQEMRESFKSLGFALLLSIVLIYMIMASQFESLWQPFIIIFTVPLSLIGVFLALFLTGTAMSAVVLLGIIILGGIVVNNGIILIDCINSLREGGMKLYDAVVESGKARLRPILMTTTTTVLGLFPLALGIGEGSELQSPMAITVMGGLSFATILTLFVIPSSYLIVSDIIESRKKKTSGVVVEVEPAPEIKPVPAPAAEQAQPVVKPKVKEPIEKLNRRHEQLLEHLKKTKKITRKEYADTFNISIPTAARDLKELLDKGLIVAHGPLGPGRWYELRE